MRDKQKKILIVDDEVKIVGVVKSYLENGGYLVYEAHNGREALEKFERVKPTLIILDLMLPDMSGEEICKILRKKSRVPIIMLTAKVEEENILEGLNIGADDYVTKPFSPRQLVARVEAVLTRSEDTLVPLASLISLEVIWDARLHDNVLCEQMLANMEGNMSSRYPNWEGMYVEDTYPISYGPGKVGKIEIGYYGPYYFNDSDPAFITKINGALISIGIFSLVLSLALSSVMSKRLSAPISRVIGTAQMISKGYFADRIQEESNTKEIALLTETVNHLAQTLEKQEVLRKRLTSDLAHELRTPLATLQGNMEAMIDVFGNPIPKG